MTDQCQWLIDHPIILCSEKRWANDYYFGRDDFEFPLGHIQMLGKSDALMYKEDAPAFAPGLTLDYIAAHSLDFWMTSENPRIPVGWRCPPPINRRKKRLEIRLGSVAATGRRTVGTHSICPR
ncbi:MAG: hypothetical protein HC880_17725 [Bacteroidia bacterium]|nr:hypothetical protein [Bacteroidia bacterium]